MTSQISQEEESSSDDDTDSTESVNLSEFLEQKSLIEKLTIKVKVLEEERDAFKKETEVLRQENASLKAMVQSHGCRGNPSPSQARQSWKLRVSKRNYSYSADQPNDVDISPAVIGKVFNRNFNLESTPKRSISLDSPHIGHDLQIGHREAAASHGESTVYENVEEKRDPCDDPCALNVLQVKSPKRASQRTSRRINRRSDSSTMYELSSDLREKNIQCLEKKYGGKTAANDAARKIQQCYRHWVLNKSFLRMRAYSGRKRSITMPEKHFEKLKKTSLVFYGPENPVMIIDDENKFPVYDDEDKSQPRYLPTSSHVRDHQLETLEPVCEQKIDIFEPVCEQKLEMLSESSNESEIVEIKIRKPSDCTENDIQHNNIVLDSVSEEGSLSSDQFVDIPAENKVVDEVLNEVFDDADGKSPIKWTISRNSSNDSTSQIDSQYDIIDESQVLTVLGKEVDTICGSRVSVDTIHDDTPDGFGFLDDTSQQYEPTFDKSMHKRQFRIGVNLFNWKPQIGIDYLIDNEHLHEDVKSIAEFLRKETTISKQKISEYFGNLRNEFSMKVLLEFAKSFEFSGKGVDEALRQFQSYFKLTGEAQTVERFLQVFSDQYVECNPGGVSENADTILLLAFALAMLNTDLHNQNVKRRMTLDEFLKNLRGTNEGNDFDPQMLSDMYNRIQKNEFATGADHTTQLHQIENSFVGKIPNLAATHRQFVKLFTLEEVVDPNRKDKPHNRLAFLFNDLLILAKPRGKSGVHGSGHIFSCKASYSLLGKKVAEFRNEHYPHGVLLLQKIDGKGIASFSMKDEDTRKSFVEELDEYIRETNGMENIRIALSKTNQLAFQNRRKEPTRCKSLFLSKNSLNSQDSGFHGMDKTETASLIDLRIGNSLEAEDAQNRSNSNTIIGSSSMNDINEGETEEKFENLIRTNSSSSLDPAVLSDSNSKNETERVEQPPSASTSRTIHSRKSLFGQLKWKRSHSALGAAIDNKLIKVFQEKGVPAALSQP